MKELFLWVFVIPTMGGISLQLIQFFIETSAIERFFTALHYVQNDR